MMNTLRRLVSRGLLLAALLTLAAPAAHAQFLAWLDAGYPAPLLSRTPVYGSVTIASLWMPPGSMPEAIAYSPATGDLVFAEGSYVDGRIRRTNPGFIQPATLVSGQSCVRGLAADAAGNIYWTTSNLVVGSQVHRCGADGSNPQVLLSLGSGSNLRGIAVDPVAGKMYLADYDQNSILVANLNGSGLTTFVALGAGAGPWGVVLDAAGQYLYWCEYASGVVRRKATSGAGAITTLYAGRVNPTHLTLLPDPGVPGGAWFLWSEAGAGAQKIVLAYLDGSGAYTTVLPVTAYGGLAITPGGTLDAGSLVPVAATLSLAPAAPNPATAASVVEFSLPSEQSARLSIVDVQGRRVASLVDGRLPAGRHRVALAATWAAHRPAAGVYFLRLEADGRQLTRKLVVAE